MELSNTSKDKDISADSGFSSSCAVLVVGENKYNLRTLRMRDSTMIFVCRLGAELLENMGVSMHGDKPSDVVGTTLLGSHISSESQTIAEKLAKRFKHPFYVSFNVQVDYIAGPLLEQQIIKHLATVYEI